MITEYDPVADEFSIENQIKRAAAGLKPKTRKENRLGQRYAKELEKLNKTEAKMSRYFRAWDKQRAKVKRLEKQLDNL